MEDSAKLASAMSIASRRPVFGLKGMSGRREAGLVFFPNPETSVSVPDSLLRSSETVLDLSAHVASLVK